MFYCLYDFVLIKTVRPPKNFSSTVLGVTLPPPVLLNSSQNGVYVGEKETCGKLIGNLKIKSKKLLCRNIHLPQQNGFGALLGVSKILETFEDGSF